MKGKLSVFVENWDHKGQKLLKEYRTTGQKGRGRRFERKGKDKGRGIEDENGMEGMRRRKVIGGNGRGWMGTQLSGGRGEERVFVGRKTDE